MKHGLSYLPVLRDRIRPLLLPAALLLAVCAPVLLVVWAVDPERAALFPVCRFHQWTGLLCPGCGGTRAVHHLLHGRLALAYQYNPGVFLAVPILGLLAAASAWRDRTQPGRRGQRWPWMAAGLLFLAYWVARNLPLFPPLP